MNNKAFEFIKQREGCRLKAYPDPASGGVPWSIGFGATGPNIGPHTVWTQEQANNDLMNRINVIQKEINSVVNVIIDENEEAALISLVYNIGFVAFKSSKILHFLNNQQFVSAANDFLNYNHADGKVNEGLTKRRQEEKELFLSTDF